MRAASRPPREPVTTNKLEHGVTYGGDGGDDDDKLEHGVTYGGDGGDDDVDELVQDRIQLFPSLSSHLCVTGTNHHQPVQWNDTTTVNKETVCDLLT